MEWHQAFTLFSPSDLYIVADEGISVAKGDEAAICM